MADLVNAIPNLYPEETNVYKFYNNCLDNNEIGDKGYKNLKRYFPGVGTEWYNRLRGGMCGYGITKQIKDAYEYISTNYRDNKDKIYLIGFSRGAYAARSIIGMINNVGLLPPENMNKIDEAYEHYRNRNKDTSPHYPLSTKFFEDNDCKCPSIHFLGCFDTVGSLGVPKVPFLGSFCKRNLPILTFFTLL
ncbi:hypothetical protein BD770DRAFT_372006 [Pilaira anomala]|nr:hypothetical protein BD770DRAFT_372006 [Pilaira anomala]